MVIFVNNVFQIKANAILMYILPQIILKKWF